MNYVHWFWNSRLIDWWHGVVIRHQNWLWWKQYGKKDS